MTEYFEYRDKILKEYLILTTIFLSLFFAFGKTNLAYGFLLGAATSGINFYLISLNNLKLINSSNKKKTQTFIIKWLFFRYILYFLTITIAFKYSIFNLSGTLLGLFVIPMTLLFSRVILKEC